MRTGVAPAIGLIIGTIVTLMFYIDGFWNPQLILITGSTWAVAGWFYVRNWNVWRQSGDLWYSVFIAVVAGSSFFGVHADLPIPEDLRIALGVLVLGVGTAALGIGAEIAIDVTSDDQRDTTSEESGIASKLRR
jgi:predicted membrane channel-forming protein YqfA (hemolysin III family)